MHDAVAIRGEHVVLEVFRCAIACIFHYLYGAFQYKVKQIFEIIGDNLWDDE